MTQRRFSHFGEAPMMCRRASMWKLRHALLATACTLSIGAIAPYGAAADPGSLYQGPEPRPGPDILYAEPPRAPQLTNAGVWAAEPILISGASAYREGEFLYQDFLYDDLGAAGRYTYPTDPDYARNAADLVELRIRPLRTATAIRLTYNTLIERKLTATTIALGSSPQPVPAPHGANARMPAQVFVTVHGSNADVVDAATGAKLKAAPRVTVNRKRRQVEVRVPYRMFDTRGQSVRVAAATGLWDRAANRYLLPRTAEADAKTPGGAAGESPTAFFNVAFRYDEPLNGSWRSSRQSAALATGDLSAFFATVDFAKLRDGVTDDMPGQVGGVPQTGAMTRILASHFEDGQGRGTPAGIPCIPPPRPLQYAGQLQPYSIYVPDKPVPPQGFGLRLELHACEGNYQLHPATAPALADEGTGSIVIQSNARGTQYWYYGEALAEVFEMWADVARRFKLDPDNTALEGISMGGYGTLKLAGQWPDLFQAGAPMVPCMSAGIGYLEGRPVPGGEGSLIRNWAPSLRHVPVQTMYGNADQVCNTWSQLQLRDDLDALGYRYDWREFVGSHVSFFPGLDYRPLAEHLDAHRVDRNPPHVTYRLNESANQPELGLNADHAYWLSDIRLRDRGSTLGRIDVFSHGFGLSDPPVLERETGTGAVPSGLTYTFQARQWDTPATQTPANRLDIEAENVRSVTINPWRAKVDCDADISVTTDGRLAVKLAGCGAPRRFSDWP
jgi:dienelactone hydrolase